MQSGHVRRYLTNERESLLASLLDGVRGSGNRDVCVKMSETVVFNRVGSWHQSVDEEVQLVYLRALAHFDPSVGITFDQLVGRFNVNVDYSGLHLREIVDSKETELIHAALNNILTLGAASFEASPAAAIEQFECLRRLLASKVGFEAFTSLEGLRGGLGKRIMSAIRKTSDGVKYAAVDMMGALLKPQHDFYDPAQEQLNKKSLLSSKAFVQTYVVIFTPRYLAHLELDWQPCWVPTRSLEQERLWRPR